MSDLRVVSLNAIWPTALRRPALAAAAGVVAFCPFAKADAQSFDCAKGKTPVELAICASPDLRDADAALGHVFSQIISRADPAKATEERAAQRAWAAQRDATCAPQADDAKAIGACLLQAYRTRTAALSARAVSAAAASPEASTSAAQTTTQAVAPAVAPAAALSPLPDQPPAGAAALARASVPAAGDTDVLLTVQTPGRFAIRASSKTGVALQLVDMIAGPGEIAGDAGMRDGRLDTLLDKGVYKLRAMGAKTASGEAALSVDPFVAASPADARLLRGGHGSAELRDLQTRSYWILVPARANLSVDATGRSLRDLRAWRDGTDLLDLEPAVSSIEPTAGHAMTRLRLEGKAEPGLYLVTAYGGDALPWTDSDATQPFHFRSGAPDTMAGSLFEGIIGPSGSMRLALPPSAAYARLELPEPAPARLTLSRAGKPLGSASILKSSREPFAATTFAKGEETVADITGLEGQHFAVRAFAPASSLHADQAGPHVVSIDVAGEGGDEVPATAILARFDKTGATRRGQVIASSVPRISPGQAWRRKFNLRGTTSLIFEIASAGRVAAQAQGPGVVLSLEPLQGVSAPRADGKIPRQWDVEAGWYTLKIDPVKGAVGLLDLTFGQPGLAVDPLPPQPPRTAIDFGLQTFDGQSAYEIFLNSAPSLVTGPKARALPADLSAGALTLLQAAKPVASQASMPASSVPTAAPAPLKAPAAKPSTNIAPKTSPESSASKLAATSKPVSTPLAMPKPLQFPAASQFAPPPTPPKPAAQQPLPPRPVARPFEPQLAGGQSLTIPVRTPLGGKISVTDAAEHAVPFTTSGDTIERRVRSAQLTIPASDAARTLVIAWVKDQPQDPLPPIAKSADDPRLSPKKPVHFDLAKDETRSFSLDAPEGGLYRIETTGRLQTSAAIGTRFLPKIAEASDNGAGHNALLQTFLRAGSYRVRVGAAESEGHLGLTASPSSLIDAGALVPGSSARATMAEGSGAAVGIEIPESGMYRLDLYGLDRTFTARLEDAEGWPLAPPGEFTFTERRFERGRYRLVVTPEDVDAQIVARLRRADTPKPLEGHGPHPLPFDAKQLFQWREPSSKDIPRTPDRWEFSLLGPAKVRLDTSDGMLGELFLLSDAAKQVSIGKIAYKRGFSGDLAPGRYALDMRAIGGNDLFDYTLDLHADEIQPGQPRLLDLPATIPFAIGSDRVVSLTTFGQTMLAGVLRDAGGQVIERVTGRTDDWNLAISTRLPTGRYTLELSEIAPPPKESEDADKTDSAGNPDDSPSAKAAAADDAKAADAEPEKDDADATPSDDPRSKIELRLGVPEAGLAGKLAFSGAIGTKGPEISTFALPAIDAGNLLAIAAESASEVAISLEQRVGNEPWRVAGTARGRSPIIAMPAADDPRQSWRVAVWPVDGGDAPISIAARAIEQKPQAANAVVLSPLTIDGFTASWRVGAIFAPSKAMLMVGSAVPGVLEGSRPGRPLAVFDGGLVAPQSERVWLIAPGHAPGTLDAKTVDSKASDLSLTLAPDDVADLPALPTEEGKINLWRAESSDGQPGFAGAAQGIAPGSALALGGAIPARVMNAGGDESLRMRVSAVVAETRPSIALDQRYAAVLAPHTAQPVRLPAGAKRIDAELGANAAAGLTGGDGAPTTIWSGGKAIARETSGAWTDALLVNTGDKPASVSIEATPAAAIEPLAAGQAMKRFFGASGSLTIPVAGKAGDILSVAGGTGAYVSADGRVTRSFPAQLNGNGELTIDHPQGLTLAWIQNATATPWATSKPAQIALPGSAALAGDAMSFAIHASMPILLRARTSAPVIAALQQNSEQGEPLPFPSGAELYRYIAPGDAELRLYSPQDGPLSGTLGLTATAVTPISEGIGKAEILAPGATALFGFEVTRAALTGAGVRSNPDRASVRLLDAKGQVLGEGAAQLRRLEPGRYLIEARAPADGETLTVRPAVVGLSPPPSGPPPDVAAKYFELVGMAPSRAR